MKLPEKKLGRSGHAKAPAAGQSTGELSKLNPALALQDSGGRAHYEHVDDGSPVAGSRKHVHDHVVYQPAERGGPPAPSTHLVRGQPGNRPSVSQRRSSASRNPNP